MLYKILYADGQPIYGKGRWLLPKGDGPGDWMPLIEGELVECKNGYHLARQEDLRLMPSFKTFTYEAEAQGEELQTTKCVVVRGARLLRLVSSWEKPRKREEDGPTFRAAAMEAVARIQKHPEGLASLAGSRWRLEHVQNWVARRWLSLVMEEG